jgi:hypothetical protein
MVAFLCRLAWVTTTTTHSIIVAEPHTTQMIA